MAFISITYDGGNEYDEDDNIIEKPIIYRSVNLKTRKEQYTFDSGNFVTDWFNALKKYALDHDNEPLSGSSSVDHFIFDGAKYDSAYLHIINKQPVLRYIDHSDPNYIFTQGDIYDNGSEYFVPQGLQPTWDKLKAYVKLDLLWDLL